MPDQYYNPFQGIDINVPVEFHELFQRYCQTSGTSQIDQSPFPRMVDLWFLSVCVAAHHEKEPVDIRKYETTKIIDGSIFLSDSWRIYALMLIATSVTNSVEVVSEPRRMMNVANGLAVAGLPLVADMIKDGESEPIWNLSDSLDKLLRHKAG